MGLNTSNGLSVLLCFLHIDTVPFDLPLLQMILLQVISSFTAWATTNSVMMLLT